MLPPFCPLSLPPLPLTVRGLTKGTLGKLHSQQDQAQVLGCIISFLYHVEPHHQVLLSTWCQVRAHPGVLGVNKEGLGGWAQSWGLPRLCAENGLYLFFQWLAEAHPPWGLSSTQSFPLEFFGWFENHLLP